MQRLQFIFSALIGLFILASTCVFTVSESQVAIRTQFREIRGETYGPGLHFKTPIADVAKETSGYYLVSYRAEHLTGLRGFQRVEVTLANPELEVTARKGYRFGE